MTSPVRVSWLAAAAILTTAAIACGCGGIVVLLFGRRPTETMAFRLTAEGPADAAEAMEREVTAPLEVALGTLPFLASIDSRSTAGRCVVDLQFKGGDWYANRQRISDALAAAVFGLPERPVVAMVAADPRQLPSVWLALEGSHYSDAELSRLADLVQQKLRVIPGVSDVQTCGLGRPYVDVALDVERMAQLQVDAITAVRALQQAGKGPAEDAVARSLDDWQNVIVASHDDAVVHVRDIANMQQRMEKSGMGLVNGRTAIAFGVLSAANENPRKFAARVREQLPALAGQLPSDVKLSMVLDLSSSGSLRRFRVEIFPWHSLHNAERRRLLTAVEAQIRRGLPGESGKVQTSLALAAPTAVSGDEELIIYLELAGFPPHYCASGFSNQLRELTGMSGTGLRAIELTPGSRPAMLHYPVYLIVPGDDLEGLARFVDAYGRRLEQQRALRDWRGDALAPLGVSVFPPSHETIEPLYVALQAIIEFEPNRQKAAELGVDIQQIAGLARLWEYGQQVGAVMEGDQRLSVRVWLPCDITETGTLLDLPVRSASGEHVPLRSVAQVRMSAAVLLLRRHNMKRAIAITGNLPYGADAKELGGIWKRIADEVHQELGVPAGYQGVEVISPP